MSPPLREFSNARCELSIATYEARNCMSAVNETLIRDVVAEVLGRLAGTTATTPIKPSPAAPPVTPAPACGCKHATANPGLRGKFGVFADANEACATAN